MFDLTIITVCRNAEKTIQRCLTAVSPLLAQADFNIEHLLVDGQSTDRTAEYIEAMDMPNRRLHSRAPRGIYDAMNFGISAASGRYVVFSNADDYVDADGIQALLRAEADNQFPSDVCHGLCCIHDDRGQLLRIQGTDSSALLVGNMIEHPSTLVKLDCLKRFGGFDERYSCASDLELMMRIRSSGASFRLYPHVVSHYFLGGASKSGQAERERLEILFKGKLISLPKYIHRLAKSFLRSRN